MRPLRGRHIRVPGSAGRALARCARPRATRGTARRVVPTAERSHCPSQCAPVATQSTMCPGKEASLVCPKIEIRTARTASPMRPLRGRRIWVLGSAGRALARCARPRATHGYFIDRSAVADHPASREAIAVKRRRLERARAHGASHGYCGGVRSSPGGAKDEPERATAVALFRPLRGFDRFLPADPRLAPWATVLSRLRRSGRMRWRFVYARLRLEEYGKVS